MRLKQPTPMQTRIVREVVQGSDLIQAAELLDIRWDTAKKHMTKLYTRIYACSQPHAVFRIHEHWPELLADILPAFPAPTLDFSQSAMLWCVSQGEKVESAADRLYLTHDAAKYRLRKTYRALHALHAAQAVHNGRVLGVLKPLGEIR